MMFECAAEINDTLHVFEDDDGDIGIAICEGESTTWFYATPATARKIAAELVRLADEMEGK